jgi:predicted dehydrogenase
LLAEHGLGLDAVAICTPPDARHDIAVQCLDAGLHLLLEKPVASSLGEAADIARRSHIAKKTAFATWHARHQPAVREAARFIAKEGLASLIVDWREDPQKWHPDQDWIWQPKGFGVFDAGLNALSIITRLFPSPILVRSAACTMHSDGQQPIEATLELTAARVSGPIFAEFDWRSGQKDHRVIKATTSAGTKLLIKDGGYPLIINGKASAHKQAEGEYPALYAHFAQLIARGRSDMDLEPLRIAADAYLIARRRLQTA